MRAAQVLDMQADLERRFHSRAFRDFIKYTMTPYYKNEIEFAAPQALVEAAHGHVKNADAYRVTDDMSMLVQYSATKLEAEDKWDHHLAPTPWGIVRFDKPLPIHDVRNKVMLIHWMTWGPVSIKVEHPTFKYAEEKPGTFVTFWNDAITMPDEVQQELFRDFNPKTPYGPEFLKVMGRWAFIGAEVIPDGTSLGEQMLPVDDEMFQRIVSEGDTPAKSWTNSRRYAHALFLLLNDTISRTTEERIPRAAQRRIGALPIPGRVSVIALRRMAGSTSHGESLAWLTHRFVVRGHWRWQRYGHGLSEQRRIWISPFVKGPEGAPFVQTTKVYELKR